MQQKILLLLMLTLVSSAGWARDYAYRAEIDGMVCAFCAYNVSKKIGTLPGVDSESVEVDLKKGRVDFRASAKIAKAQLAAVFSESGFTLNALTEMALSRLKSVNFDASPIIVLTLDDVNSERFVVLLDAIGEIASTQQLQLTAEAPKAIEMDLLKPILAGRKHVIKVHFVPTETRSIQLKLFAASVPE